MALGVSLALSPPSLLVGQSPATLSVSFAGEEGATLPVASHRGYPSLPAAALLSLGWQADDRGTEVFLRHRTGIQLAFVPGSPFLAWDGDLFQMAEAAYRFDGQLHVPLQLVVDLFPGLLPRAYEWDRERRILRVAERPSGPFNDPPTSSSAAEGSSPPPPLTRAPRVVIIDPGHGGSDPGAIGPGGTREKDVALAVGLELSRLLAEDPEVEVRLTRDRDLLVPIWERGERATAWKGDRPGVFVSIHANGLPGRPEVRGFETYFLSEARTEHERRVAAAENAPLYQGGGRTGLPPHRTPSWQAS